MEIRKDRTPKQLNTSENCKKDLKKSSCAISQSQMRKTFACKRFLFFNLKKMINHIL